MILDTNAVSALLAGDAAIRPIIANVTTPAIPTIVIGEYRYGLVESSRADSITSAFDRLLRAIRVLTVDEDTADRYAEVRRSLKVNGTPIPENDIWIAALARQHELAVLSRDRHFDHVFGIQRVGW